MRKGRLKRRLAEALQAQGNASRSARDATSQALRLRLACEAIPQTMVVCDERRQLVLRNRNGFEQAPWAPLIESAIDDMVRAGAPDEPRSRRVEFRGPPPKSLVITVAALRNEDEWLGTVAFVDDESERRQLEQVRRDFVANVSHELRTPIGALGLLGEALTGETDADVVARLAERITAEAHRAAQMIEDLLDLSRIEAHGLPVRDPVSADAMVRAAVERVRPTAEMKGVEIVTSLRIDGPPEIPGDEAQLVSAVSNLLDNAVKYSDRDSTVKVKVRRGDDGWVEISVRDRGIGIPSKDLERIFERFYRVDRARSRVTGGTGLGLSIVRHVADNHGGEVTVVSQEGAGSTFLLRLPTGPG
jgi:two-component system sensor histidine kinase SenX3